MKSSKKKDPQQSKPSKQNPGSRIRKIEKLADEGEYKHKKLGKDVRMKIQQARCSKKMSQKQLANSINVQEQVIKDIESGKSNYNPKDMNKIKRFLKI